MKIFLRVSFFFFFVCVFAEVNAQHFGRFKNNVRDAALDKERTQALLDLGDAYLEYYPDSAESCYNDARSISVKNGFKDDECVALLGLAKLKLYQYESDDAEKILDEALEIGQSVNLDDSPRVQLAYGNVYFYANDFVASTRFQAKAFSSFRKSEGEQRSKAVYCISQSYLKRGLLDSALHWQSKAVYRKKWFSQAPMWKVYGLSQMSSLNYYSGHLDSMNFHASLARDISIKNNSVLGEMRAEYLLGVYEFAIGDYAKCIDVFTDLTNRYDSMELDKQYLRSLHMIGVTYSTMSYPDIAKEYYEKLQIRSRGVNYKDGIALAQVRLATCTGGDRDVARMLLDSALHFYKAQNDIESIVEVMIAMSGSYLWQEKPQPQETLNLLTEIRKVQKQIEDLENEMDYWFLKGMAFSYLNELDSAKASLELGLKLANVSAKPEFQTKFYQELSRILYLRKDYKGACNALNVIGTIKGEQLRRLSIGKLNYKKHMELEYERQLGDIQNSNLESQAKEAIKLKSALLMTVCFGLLATILLIAVLNRSKKLRELNQLLREKGEKIELLMKDMVHRSRSNYQLMRNLLEMQYRSAKEGIAKETLMSARNRIDVLQRIEHSILLNERTEDVVDMSEVLSGLASGLRQAYGYPKETMNVQVEAIDFSANQGQYTALLASEILINAFRHGLLNVKGPKLTVKLLLLSSSTEQSAMLTIRDNGPGIREHGDASATSYGQKLISLFVKQLKAKLSVFVTNGTKYEVIIPVNNEVAS